MNRQIETKIKDYCLLNKDEECCGVICDDNDSYVVVPISNCHPNKENEFRLSSEEYIRAEINIGNILFVYHSHINGKGISFVDKIKSNSYNIPFIVYDLINNKFDYYTPKPINYLNRDFQIGIFDCFTLVRDYYKHELGINIKNYFRDEKWFDKNPEIFDKNIEREGFEIVHSGKLDGFELQIHDCILFELSKLKKSNHIGVYVGNNYFLHHPMKGKSILQKIDSYYGQKIRYVIRHKDTR